MVGRRYGWELCGEERCVWRGEEGVGVDGKICVGVERWEVEWNIPVHIKSKSAPKKCTTPPHIYTATTYNILNKPM